MEKVTKNNTYQVIWVSPRGFTNEGYYAYGSNSELESFCNHFDYTSGMTSAMSNHRTSDAARFNAERLARRDRKSTAGHEICCIDHLHISEMS